MLKENATIHLRHYASLLYTLIQTKEHLKAFELMLENHRLLSSMPREFYHLWGRHLTVETLDEIYYKLERDRDQGQPIKSGALDLLTRLCSLKDVNRAIETLLAFPSFNVKPHLFTFKWVMGKHYATNPRITQQLLQDIIQAGLTPDKECYHFAIKASLHEDQPYVARTIFNHMIQNKITPLKATFVELIKRFEDLSDSEEVRHLYQQMKEHGYIKSVVPKPTPTTKSKPRWGKQLIELK
jgi:hypothetical protein